MRAKRNPLANNLGSVSSGNMNPEYLIPVLLSELESQKPLHRPHRKLAREINQRIGASETIDAESGQARDNYYESDDADYDLEALFEALGEYCLPYFYFGAHPGDGADYGYWLSEDFRESFEYDGGLVVNHTSEIPTGYTGEVLHVNDHGNMTLYYCSRGKRREVWAIV